MIKVLGNSALFFQFINDYPWVIDKGTEIIKIILVKLRKNMLHFIFYNSGGIIENMVKSLILAMNIRDKMFSALGHAKFCLKIDNSRINVIARWVFFR